MELDVSAVEPDERAGLAEAIAVYKRLRAVLHSGEVVRIDHPDPAAWVHGVVAADRAAAVFAYVQLAGSTAESPAPARLAGLDPERRYAVAPLPVGGEPATMQAAPPDWMAGGGLVLSGRTLESVGLAMPVLEPEQALVIELRSA
jgi:alpha-galactosidase